MPLVAQIVPQVALRPVPRSPSVAERLEIMSDVAGVVPEIRAVVAYILSIVPQLVGRVVLGGAGMAGRVRPDRAGPMRAACTCPRCATAASVSTARMTASATAVRVSTARPSRQRANQTYRSKVMEHRFLAAEKNGSDRGRLISPVQT